MALIDKPEVFRKFKEFFNYVNKNDGKIGVKQRGIDINVNNACNLRCKHCFTNSPLGDHIKEWMDPKVISRIADEAHELGIFEWDLQGGEPLLRKKYLWKVLDAIGTERFYMYVTTNGYYLDQAAADKMAEHGVDRVSVSIDSMDPKEHDDFRGRKSSWERALRSLEYVQKAGMDPFLNITVGHFNAKSDDVKLLLDYSKDNKYTTLLNVATPAGMWSNLTEIMCDDEDRAYLIEMRKKYKNILRNLWNPFDRKNEAILGCNTVNRLYITPLGDVLACPYVHIKLGNIYESSLKEISTTGFQFSRFRNYSEKCLAGEDIDFAKKFMSTPGTSIFNPIDVKELIKKEKGIIELETHLETATMK